MTLARDGGAVFIGQPLDLQVQNLLDAGEDMASQCLGADVFYGDSQVAPTQVLTTIQQSTPAAQASIRIQVSLPVNEPFVTVYVRTGCAAPFTRRYVLLADLPDLAIEAGAESTSEAAFSSRPPVVATAPAQLPPLNVETAAAPALDAPLTPVAQEAQAPGLAPAPRAVASPPARTQRPRAPSVVRQAAAPSAPGTPRLQLDPPDLSPNIERNPVLQLSGSLLSEPSASEESRAAATRLWQAIDASPQDILRDAQKLALLQTEFTRLRQAEAKNQATLADLQSRLEASRHLNWLSYLLGALLLLSLLTLWALWRGRIPGRGLQATGVWWASANQNGAGQRKPTHERNEVADVDIDLNLDQDSSFDSQQHGARAHRLDARPPPAPLTVSDLPKPDRRHFASSLNEMPRSMATEELIDVQQQADFFVSLGEDEQAIQVLKNHLSESHEPSALAYLDLLNLYHRLGRRADYEKSREEFNHVFNAGAPPFDQYTDQRLGLETYETAFSRIQALWPQPKVLDVIERSIFRDPSNPKAEVFNLEAYRELLLLHAMAKDMIQRQAPATRPATDFQYTGLQPLNAQGKPGAALATGVSVDGHPEPSDLTPPASPRLGLDVDLSDFAELSAVDVALPEGAHPTPVQPNPSPDTAPTPTPTPTPTGNLIDFEVLDCTPPEEGPATGPRAGRS